MTARRTAAKRDEAAGEQEDTVVAGDANLEAAGFVRDERGLRFVKESDD